jgi:hypothetical protein
VAGAADVVVEDGDVVVAAVEPLLPDEDPLVAPDPVVTVPGPLDVDVVGETVAFLTDDAAWVVVSVAASRPNPMAPAVAAAATVVVMRRTRATARSRSRGPVGLAAPAGDGCFGGAMSVPLSSRLLWMDGSMPRQRGAVRPRSSCTVLLVVHPIRQRPGKSRLRAGCGPPVNPPSVGQRVRVGRPGSGGQPISQRAHR